MKGIVRLMKALLIGEIFSENLGDQLVYFATKMLIQQQYPEMEFSELDIMGRTGYPELYIERDYPLSKEYNRGITRRIKDALQSWNIADFAIKYRSAKKNSTYYDNIISKRYDVAIFVGGQVISDTFGTFLFEIVRLLEHYHIPIIFNSVDLGVLKNKFQKENYLSILKSNYIVGISCRCDAERLNHSLLKDNKTKAIFAFDSGIFASDLFNVSRKQNTSCVGLGIMMSSRYKTEVIIRFWVNIIEKLNQSEIKWKVFTTGQTSDYLLAKRILIIIGYPENQICQLLVQKPQTPVDLVRTIAEFDRILSFRLHSHIIAYALDVPSIAIAWDEKIKDFMRKTYNSDNYFTISSNTDDILQSLLKISRTVEHEQIIFENKKQLKNTLYGFVNDVSRFSNGYSVDEM